MVGCGNSRLSEDMFKDGYTNITNIDHSQTVIKQMQELYRDKCPEFVFKQMDARNMGFADGMFDCVIDKACFDAVLCADGQPNTDSLVNHIHRVLSPEGVYICVSYGVPEKRMKYFAKRDYEWTVFTHKAPKPVISTCATNAPVDPSNPDNFHYIYIMRKPQKPEPSKPATAEKSEKPEKVTEKSEKETPPEEAK